MSAQGEKTTGIRSFQDGQWYWAPRIVIQEMSKVLGFLALAVYHFLASMADERQTCFPSQSYIAEKIGCSRSSVTRAIKVLESHGLIGVYREGKKHNGYRLLKVGGSTSTPSMSIGAPSEVNRCDTNDIRLIKGDANARDFENSRNKPSDDFKPKTRDEMLAYDLAIALNEPDEIPLYLTFAHSYSESFLREILARVNETPRHRIKKSRAALFTYLVRRYGGKDGENLSS